MNRSKGDFAELPGEHPAESVGISNRFTNLSSNLAGKKGPDKNMWITIELSACTNYFELLGHEFEHAAE